MTQIEFNHAVTSNYMPLKGYALKLTQKAEDANDLVQETMYKAFRNRDKFMDGTNLKGWLYTIMKNLFINNYRRVVRGKVGTDESENQYYLNSAPGREENLSSTNMAMDDIHEAIDSISENLRVPFLMSFNGYKYEEIASELNLPLGTVKIRIHMARKKLKVLLANYGEEYGFALAHAC